MRKQIVVLAVILANILLASCGLVFDEHKHQASRVKAIVSALEERDSTALKTLFSQKALDEADWDDDVDSLFDFFDGNIIAWEQNDGSSGDTVVADGKKTVMLRYGFDVTTDTDKYCFFVIDYAEDTIDSSNKGLYMLEVCKESYGGKWDAWQDRMKAGISIIQEDRKQGENKGTVLLS